MLKKWLDLVFLFSVVFGMLSPSSWGMEQEEADELVIVAEGPKTQLHYQKCDFPIKANPEISRDTDACRLIYLSSLTEDADGGICVPKGLRGTFCAHGTSHKRLKYSGAVFGCIGVSWVVASLISAYAPPCDASNRSVADCMFYSSGIPNIVLCAGSIGANIGGLLAYDTSNKKFEEARNRAQDATTSIKNIYSSLAKFALRTYLTNLYLAKERTADMPAEDQVGDLDNYLTDRPVVFSDLFKFLGNLKIIIADLKGQQVNADALNEIETKLSEVSGLILGTAPEEREARQMVLRLVFDNVKDRYNAACVFDKIITDEDLFNVLTTYLK